LLIADQNFNNFSLSTTVLCMSQPVHSHSFRRHSIYGEVSVTNFKDCCIYLPKYCLHDCNLSYSYLWSVELRDIFKLNFTQPFEKRH